MVDKTKKTGQVDDVDESIQGDDCQHERRILEAKLSIERHSMTAMGVGVIPVPLVDLVAITGVQLNMLRKLSNLYEVEFSNKIGQKSVISLVGGALPVFAALPAASLFQSIPVIGWALGSTSMSILAGASTYAVGNVFARHFESGGTLLDFDAKASKAYMKEQYAKGKEKVSSFTNSKSTADDGTTEAA